MKSSTAVCAALALLLAAPARAQDTTSASPNRSRSRADHQDVLVPITSVEWGAPDRWSVTSRYIHMFQKDRNRKATLHNLTVAISPGTAGGRLGVGYQNIHTWRKEPRTSRAQESFALLSEARVVLVRTWGNPLRAAANQNFVGGELRTSLAGVLSIGVGYYAGRHVAIGGNRALWSVHIGVGL